MPQNARLLVRFDLYFRNGDPISIHTLTWAAYSILADINEVRGGPPMKIDDVMVTLIKPEFQKEFQKMLREAHTFFKHADRTPDAVLEFDPIQTEMVLYEACEKYRELTGEYSPHLFTFIIWYVANNRKYFKPSQVGQAGMFDSIEKSIYRADRRKYYDWFLPMATAATDDYKKEIIPGQPPTKQPE